VKRTTVRLCCALLAGVLLGCGDSSTGPNPADYPSDPAQAQFNSSDVDRYWRAYDAGGRVGQGAVFQRIYLDSASVPLSEFVGLRSVTAASLTQVAIAFPRYLEALRSWWPTITPRDPVFTEVRANYARIKQLYPEAFFPPVTILMGRYSTGGTVGRNGVFIGLEFFGTDARAPTAELNAFGRNNQKSWSNELPALIAHEHVHLLQGAAGSSGRSSKATLLARALNEGVAEFVGSLSARVPTFLAFYSAWQRREFEFWTAFARERSGTDASRWLYNQESGTTEWPGDLGYFMGYRIAQAYYNQAADKTQAIKDLIALKDAEAILARSGYAGSGPPIIVGSPVSEFFPRSHRQ
jgi:Predicted Zn-dependent protease (DUF2268)